MRLGVHQRKVRAGGTGAAPLVAGILPADRQERSSRPPPDEHPTQRPPAPLAPVTTTFTAPEGVRIFKLEITGRALTARERRPFAKSPTESRRSLGDGRRGRAGLVRPAILSLKNTDALRRSERSCHRRERRGG